MKNAAKERESLEPAVPRTEQKAKVVPIGERGVRLSERLKRARELLSCYGIPAKFFAPDLEVTERYIRQMATGEKPIQQWMTDKIIEIGEEELWKQKEAIDRYMRQALKDQFGRLE